MTRPVKLAVAGLGVVGSGVVDLIETNRQLLQKRLGRPVRVAKALVRDLKKPRSVNLAGIDVTDDLDDFLEGEGYDVMLELMGGKETALEIYEHCFRQGVPLITANKALLAEESSAIAGLYEKKAPFVGFDAAVAGAIPILKNLKYGLCANEIEEIKGILNGTANYILTKMDEENMDFAKALELAQEAGFAEADPSADINGPDSGHKLCLLLGEIFDRRFNYGNMLVEGIAGLKKKDLRYAAEFGYKAKLLAIGRKTPSGGIDARVHPALVPMDSPLGKVGGANNCVYVKGNFCGTHYSTGPGAGSRPTASAVVSDLVNCYEEGKQERSFRTDNYFFFKREAEFAPLDAFETSYYLRMVVEDTPGVLAEIAGILTGQGISVSRMMQKLSPETPQRADLVFITHQAMEAKIKRALSGLSQKRFILDRPETLRIEERF